MSHTNAGNVDETNSIVSSDSNAQFVCYFSRVVVCDTSHVFLMSAVQMTFFLNLKITFMKYLDLLTGSIVSDVVVCVCVCV